MEAAASVIAVLSLAVQIGDSSRRVCDLLKSVKNAPKEVGAIIDQVNLLQLTVDTIAKLAEKQQRSRLGIDGRVSDAIEEALRQCESKIDLVYSFIAPLNLQRVGSSVLQKIACIGYGFKKHRLEELGSELATSIAVLNLVISAHMMHVQINQTAHMSDSILLSLSDNGVVSRDVPWPTSPPHTSLPPLKTYHDSFAAPSKQFKESRRSLLGLVSLAVRSTRILSFSATGEGTESEVHCIDYTIQLPFISRCFQIQTRLPFAFSLSVVNIVPPEVEKQILDYFFVDDFPAVRQLFADRICSVHDVTTYGDSLLTLGWRATAKYDHVQFMVENGCAVTDEDVGELFACINDCFGEGYDARGFETYSLLCKALDDYDKDLALLFLEDRIGEGFDSPTVWHSVTTAPEILEWLIYSFSPTMLSTNYGVDVCSSMKLALTAWAHRYLWDGEVVSSDQDEIERIIGSLLQSGGTRRYMVEMPLATFNSMAPHNEQREQLMIAWMQLLTRNGVDLKSLDWILPEVQTSKMSLDDFRDEPKVSNKAFRSPSPANQSCVYVYKTISGGERTSGCLYGLLVSPENHRDWRTYEPGDVQAWNEMEMKWYSDQLHASVRYVADPQGRAYELLHKFSSFGPNCSIGELLESEKEYRWPQIDPDQAIWPFAQSLRYLTAAWNIKYRYLPEKLRNEIEAYQRRVERRRGTYEAKSRIKEAKASGTWRRSSKRMPGEWKD